MLQIGKALFYYKLGQTLLKIGAASLLQLGQLSQIKATVIAKWGSYNKLGKVLQIRAIVTNWDITPLQLPPGLQQVQLQ